MVDDDLMQSDAWKIKLTIAINFMSSKNNKKERVMHSKSDNIEIMSHDKADEDIEQLFGSLLLRYQIGLETSLKSKDLIIQLIYYILNVIK